MLGSLITYLLTSVTVFSQARTALKSPDFAAFATASGTRSIILAPVNFGFLVCYMPLANPSRDAGQRPSAAARSCLYQQNVLFVQAKPHQSLEPCAARRTKR